VLANARSEVLVEHCRRSHAGLFYANRWEFVEALKLLMKDARLRAEMGRNGKAYVNQHYRWNTVLAKYERLFSRLRGGAREQDAGARSQGTPVHHGAPARHPNRPTHPRGPSRHQRRR
jgi:hypothetical protein